MRCPIDCVDPIPPSTYESTISYEVRWGERNNRRLGQRGWEGKGGEKGRECEQWSAKMPRGPTDRVAPSPPRPKKSTNDSDRGGHNGRRQGERGRQGRGGVGRCPGEGVARTIERDDARRP